MKRLFEGFMGILVKLRMVEVIYIDEAPEINV